MPTYEYRCPEGHNFELFQRMSDDPVAECPQCGVEAERLLSAGAGFIFKGSGFYLTDYRSEGYKEAARKDGADIAPAVSPSDPAEKPAAASAGGTEPGGSVESSSGSSGSSDVKGTGSDAGPKSRGSGKGSGNGSKPRGSEKGSGHGSSARGKGSKASPAAPAD